MFAAVVAACERRRRRALPTTALPAAEPLAAATAAPAAAGPDRVLSKLASKASMAWGRESSADGAASDAFLIPAQPAVGAEQPAGAPPEAGVAAPSLAAIELAVQAGAPLGPPLALTGADVEALAAGASEGSAAAAESERKAVRRACWRSWRPRLQLMLDLLALAAALGLGYCGGQNRWVGWHLRAALLFACTSASGLQPSWHQHDLNSSLPRCLTGGSSTRRWR